ncbi:MAG: hypothetical protein CL938_15820, partial [Deltaproteobacteria bacterium]|nr:hypothetical protein [Deltaproteobacteria bacterium]
APYRGLFPSPPLFDRMPTYRTQGKRSLNFLSAAEAGFRAGRVHFSRVWLLHVLGAFLST